jgi:hypothetical protein
LVVEEEEEEEFFTPTDCSRGSPEHLIESEVVREIKRFGKKQTKEVLHPAEKNPRATNDEHVGH